MRYLAQVTEDFKKTFGQINPPDQVKKIGGGQGGDVGINEIIAKSIEFIFVIGAVGFVIMFLISAVQMIISGGDKEAVGKARARLNWAIIGLVILALSFVIFRVLGQITGFQLAPK